MINLQEIIINPSHTSLGIISIYKVALLLVKDGLISQHWLLTWSITWPSMNRKQISSRPWGSQTGNQGMKLFCLPPGCCEMPLASALGVCPSFCFSGKLHCSLFSRHVGCTCLCMTWLSTFTLTLHHIPHYLPTPWINSEFQETTSSWSCRASCPSLSHLGRAAHL